ncbi:type I glyceraldehyde-3-phosphate dehydrogenase [candidate division WS5 bacterium]|uniref:Glyceraldehyde-3-phosphate dehydrogenase n=1 Tax=candidate division WS5 bacterium TaxID=2093353 RepID=A0A419DCD4_9BACT|nr:MAG: type I glyceraldehyde-3-phosphate dehydrogenase [candidate division WS5 bacterium]
MIRVTINGFGRIGRAAFRIILDKYEDEIEVVAINDLSQPEVLAHLLQYDSSSRRWDKEVFATGDSITIEDKQYPVLAEKIPVNLPWKNLNIDVVLECTGRFTDEEGMKQHLMAGAKKVLLSAPAKSDSVPTYLIGVNHQQYKGEPFINNASCTTNCIAPIADIIQERFGIHKAMMTTAHAVTAEQNLVDGPPPGGKAADLRRARAAYVNIIPTTTGAAVATAKVIPELEGIFDGMALRVPVIDGSLADFTFLIKEKTTVEEVNKAIKQACDQPRWQGIVTWSNEPLVSSDIVGRPESAIVDLPLTLVVDGDLIKICAWYDNEYGYSNRLVEQTLNIGKFQS